MIRLRLGFNFCRLGWAVVQVNEKFLKGEYRDRWCKKGDKTGMHVAMEMTFEPRMTFDPGTYTLSHHLLQQ